MRAWRRSLRSPSWRGTVAEPSISSTMMAATGVYVFVEDVDAHCLRARGAGANVLIEPADQPWGDRMYCATDPEGQFWMFAKLLA